LSAEKLTRVRIGQLLHQDFATVDCLKQSLRSLMAANDRTPTATPIVKIKEEILHF
jgi:hypothetical protein